MKIPGLDRIPGMNMNRMMEQMQQQQQEMQRQLEAARCEGTAGGGIVKVVVNGMKAVISVHIEPDALADREMLQDLIAAAVNDAGRRADEVAQGQMQNMLGGLDLGGLKIPGLS